MKYERFLFFSLSVVFALAGTVQAGLVHHWALDEDTGAGATEAIDAAGSNNGTINGATTAPGVLGNALYFDGSSNNVIIDNVVSANLTTMTITFWMNPDIGYTATSGWKRVISAVDQWEAILVQNTGNLGNNFFRSGGDFPQSTDAPPEGQWTHVAMTADHAGTGRMEIYVNGVYDTPTNPDILTNADWTESTIAFGSRADNGGAFYKGFLDDVRIYDEILTEDQIKAIMGGNQAILIAPEIDKSITTPYNFEWQSGWPGGAKQVIKYLMYLDPNEAEVADKDDRKLPGGTRLVEDQLVLAPVLDPNGPVLYNVTDTLEYDTPYFWAVDTYVGEPNVAGIGFINIEYIPGDTWRFWGPFSIPDLAGPEDLYILPDPLTHEFPANPQASFTVTITSAFDVYDAVWYKESDPGNAILSAGRFSIVTTDTESTLTISDVVTTDNDTYYCVVRLDIDGNPGTPEESDHAILVLSSILRHRYSFSGNADDSVGGAHGTVQDPGIATNITFANGQVVFDDNLVAGENQTSDDPNLHWVDLPNGIVSALGDHATFMIWYTIEDPAAPDNVRVFTAGDADGSGTEAEYIDGAWTGMAGDGPWVEIVTRGGNLSFGSRGAGAVAANDGAAANYVDQEICLAGVWDGSNSQMILYVNGSQTGTAIPQRKLADLADVSNWLGRSNSTNDKAFIGKINELRIYDVPLTRHWIEAMCEAGPDVTDVNPCLLDEYNPHDYNFDCVVDVLDFAKFAEQWLYCGLLNCP